MTPHAKLIAELRLVLSGAETDAAIFRAAQGRGAAIPHDKLEDHRAHIYGQIVDALDMAEPGLGTALHRAMYPLTNLNEEVPT